MSSIQKKDLFKSLFEIFQKYDENYPKIEHELIRFKKDDILNEIKGKVKGLINFSKYEKEPNSNSKNEFLTNVENLVKNGEIHFNLKYLDKPKSIFGQSL